MEEEEAGERERGPCGLDLLGGGDLCSAAVLRRGGEREEKGEGGLTAACYVLLGDGWMVVPRTLLACGTHPAWTITCLELGSYRNLGQPCFSTGTYCIATLLQDLPPQHY